MSRRAAVVLAAAVAVLACVSVAAAGWRHATGMHDARYCEVLELRGTIPDAEVKVWNTFGLNKCPEKLWSSLDAQQIADERGDTLVLLNGPRHWLMDSAAAQTGPVHSFDGLRARLAATIPIHSAADLAQTAYTERTIDRKNTWRYDAGRRVYELVAPNDKTYVMQSYSQIVDPDLEIGDLTSLGDRLDPPCGWHYRGRRLSEPLVLRARGKATIIQDDLKDTYQLVPRKLAPSPVRQPVHVRGETKEVGSSGGVVEDQGTITGPPFCSGSVDVFVTFVDGSHATATFDIDAPNGTASGTSDLTYVIEGSEITFDGTANFTGGTGRYADIAGENLRVHDHNTLDGQNGTLSLDGAATY